MKLKYLVLLLFAQLLSLPVLAEEKVEGAADETRYLELSPPLVTNYGGPGRMKYIKAEVSLRVDSQDEFRAVMHHVPLLRHTMVMLLSKQTDESVGSQESKEQLRLEALAATQAMMQAEEGKPMIDDLLFSTFFVQR